MMRSQLKLWKCRKQRKHWRYIIWSRRYNSMERNSNNNLGLPENSLLRYYITWRKTVVFRCEIPSNCLGKELSLTSYSRFPIQICTKLPHDSLHGAFSFTPYGAIHSCRTNCPDIWKPFLFLPHLHAAYNES